MFKKKAKKVAQKQKYVVCLSKKIIIKVKHYLNYKLLTQQNSKTMKTRTNLTMAILITIAFSFISIQTIADTARLQVIHNSADKAAEFVDVWLDDTLLLDDFEFRSASPYIDAPAGSEFTISIQGSDSQSPQDPLWSQKYVLEEGETYVLIANGIISPEGYNPATPFDIFVYPMGREVSNNTGTTDVMIFHGATDAPLVDVVEIGVGAGTIANDLGYGDFTGYLELPTTDYIIDIMDFKGEVSVQKYGVPLASLNLDGAALVTVASGFLSPENNSDGQAFGLWVALPAGGKLIPLPEYKPTARVQVIHNSPDQNAQFVDVWVNDSLIIDNFKYQTASPFFDFPAMEEFTISVTDKESTNPFNPVWSGTYSLEENGTYILVASGIVTPQSYNPSIPFDIFVYDMGREMSMQNGFTDMNVFHGSTDAPTVDIIQNGAESGLLIDNLSYGEFSGYAELPTNDYIIDVKDENREATVISFSVPLETLGLENYAIVVVASGFLNPGNNNNGQEFGLWVALPSGGELVQLPVYNPAAETARVQVIHNSADMAAEVVDIWLDDMLLIDDFKFRTSTPFIDAPANTEFTISVLGSNSQSPENPIWSQNYTLENGETYLLIANGIVVPDGYSPSTPFDIYVYPMGREEASSMGNTDVLVFHGSTDAPTVDIVETGVGAGTIVNDLMYGDFAGYLELPTDNYRLAIMDETGTVTVAEYEAPLAALGLDNYSITVVASGFLNPAENNNGEAFGLWVSLPGGGNLMPLSIITSLEEAILDKNSVIAYPNPATSVINVSYNLKQNSSVSIDLYDIMGNMVRTVTPEYNIQSAQTVSITTSDLAAGIYFVRVQAANEVTTKRINLINQL